jgi:hypothetical protein
MAQQARPNWAGQIAERRAHCTTHSNLVVRKGQFRIEPVVMCDRVEPLPG